MMNPKRNTVICTLLALVFCHSLANANNTLLGQTDGESGLRLEVKFDSNSSSLNKDSYPFLDRVAKEMKDPIWMKEMFVIEGHTDQAGAEDYNLILSIDRAEAVRSYLLNKHGIDRQRLMVKGYGELQLIDPSKTLKANKINRRVILRHKISAVDSAPKSTFNEFVERTHPFPLVALILIASFLGGVTAEFAFRKIS